MNKDEKFKSIFENITDKELEDFFNENDIKFEKVEEG